jgi:hypothetical protein
MALTSRVNWRHLVEFASCEELTPKVEQELKEIQVKPCHIDLDGRTRTVHETVTVTDFDIQIDLSQYISKGWSSIACQPEKGETPMNFKDTLQGFCNSKNVMKE